MSRIGTKLVAMGALLAIVAGSARAQYVAPQNNQPTARLSSNQPAAQTQAFQAGVAQGRVAGFNAGVASQSQQQQFGGYGYGGYGLYYPGAAGGYLQGVAAVTNANAQYQVTIQQARLAQSQADMSKIDVRRRIRDEDAYERSQIATPEQVRINDMNANLARARNNPPSGEIWSAVALNDLLQANQTMHRSGLYGPAIALPSDLLRHISVTTGTTRGNVGVLNDGQKPQWPFALRTNRYKSDREQLDILVPEVYGQAGSSNGIDPDTLRKAQGIVRNMDETVRGAVADLTPDEFTSSRRFLTQLRDALRVLEQPDAGNYTKGKWIARGRTVPELIDNMTRDGLKFAPASPGNEPYYTSFFQYLASYDSALARIAGGAALTAAPPPRR